MTQDFSQVDRKPDTQDCEQGAQGQLKTHRLRGLAANQVQHIAKAEQHPGSNEQYVKSNQHALAL